MENIIFYIFFIQSVLIGIFCLRPLNGVDAGKSDLPKRMPVWIKRVLLIGKNVEKISVLMFLASILNQIYLLLVTIIFLFANQNCKENVALFLIGSWLPFLFFEGLAMRLRVEQKEVVSEDIEERVITVDSKIFERLKITSLAEKKGNIYLFPYSLFMAIKFNGDTYSWKDKSKNPESLTTIGDYESLSIQLVQAGYQVIRFETKPCLSKELTEDEYLDEIQNVIKQIQLETENLPIYLIGHGETCNWILPLEKKIPNIEALILLCGGMKEIEELNCVMKKALLVGVEVDFRYSMECVEQILHNKNITIKYISETDFTFRKCKEKNLEKIEKFLGKAGHYYYHYKYTVMPEYNSEIGETILQFIGNHKVVGGKKASE